MGLFILGIGTGWLLEWLFFTFVVKSKMYKGNDEKCFALKQELEAKNKQIINLQEQLAETSNEIPKYTPPPFK